MNKIKFITTYVIADHTPPEGIPTVREERDMQGNILMQEQYYEDGNVEQRVVSTYDNENRVLTMEQYSGGEEPDQRFEYTYNESGKVSQIKIYYRDGSISVRHYERNEAENTVTVQMLDEEDYEEAKEFRRLDSEGRVLEEIVHEDGELHHHIKTSYDDHGRPISRYSKDAEGYETDHIYEYELDDEGRIELIEVVEKEDQEELVRADSFEYDERGNESKHLIENHREGYSAEMRKTYDMNNRVIMEQHFSGGGSLTSETSFKYDDNNLLLEESSRSTNGVSLNVFKYEFH